jgi:chromosome segregation ATPase
MPTRKKPATPRKAAKKVPALRQLAQLRKTVKGLRVKLERETRARMIEARVKTEAQKARAQLASQIAALRDQGRKLATNLKSALGDASKRDAARQQALAKIAELKAEYSKKTADLRSELSRATAELGRKSEELKKLAGEAANRAVEIIRSDEPHAAPGAPMGGSSELAREVSPQEIEDRGDDKEPDEEQ